MTDKIVLAPLASLQNDTTAINVINNNSDIIEAAFNNTLSRDGTQPNTMSANIDMNSNRIVNLPAPSTADEPARLQDLSTVAGGGTVSNLLPGGTTGQFLAKASNADFDVQWASESSELVAGTNIAITGTSPATISTVTGPTFGSVNVSGLTASQAVQTDGSKNLVSVPNTGSGNNVLATSPTLTTPTIGAATATSVNKVAITAPATSATLTIPNGVTLTGPAASGTVATLANSETLTNKTINGANNTLSVRLANDVTGNLPVTNLNSGTGASTSTFWRGDGQWVAPAGSGNVVGSGTSVVGNSPLFSNTTATGLTDSGLPSAGFPWTIGEVTAATPKTIAGATITIATPAVITWTSHGLVANAQVVFTSTGALPTGIVSGTTYYVVGSSITTNTFQIATTVANAKASVSVATSGTQSGTHTVVANLTADVNSIGSFFRVDVPSGSAITMNPSGTVFNIASVALPAGRWLTWGNVVFSAQGSTAYSEVHASLSTVSATVDPSPGSSHAFHTTFGTGQAAIIPTTLKFVPVTTSTTLFLVATTTWTTSAMLAYGSIFGVRL